MVYRLSERNGTAGSDALVGLTRTITFGLQGNDTFTSGTWGDEQIFAGGSGNDTYRITQPGAMTVAENANSSFDVVVATGIGIFRPTTYAITIEGRHLAVFDEASEQLIYVLDWTQPANRIESVQLADGTYSYDYIAGNIWSMPGYLGDLSWAQLYSLIGEPGPTTAEIDEALTYYAARSATLEAIAGASVTAPDTTVGEGVGSATVSLNLGQAYGTAISVNVSVGIGGGTATATTDYQSFTTSVTFQLGEVAKTISIPIVDDVAPEGTETVRISISSGLTGSVLDIIQVSILDNDTPSPGKDSLAGGSGNDTIAALGGDDIVYGNTGADRLLGEAGNDSLLGGSGSDSLYGGADNDFLDGGLEADLLDGGDGFDVARFSGAVGPVTIRVLGWGNWEAVLPGGVVQQLVDIEAADAPGGIVTTGSVGDDMVNGSDAGDNLDGGLGNDYLGGGNGNDSLSGAEGQDWLWAGPGNDSLSGGAEKDNINGEAGDDTIDAGTGNDRITGKDGNDVIHAGEGNDWVGVWNDWGEDPALNYFPEGGDDQILGDGGDDVLSAGFGRDTVDGGIGNDYVAGEQDDDILYGGEGQDWLWAGTGQDTLDGGAMKDNLNGEGGNDLIYGGDGNDRICGQQDNDEIHAGAGNDWVGVWNDWGEDPALNYFPEAGDDLIFGDEGNDVLSAGFGRDTVHGGAGDDYVAGEQEDDFLFGNEGTDWLWAGSDNDSLDGGAGIDRLIGEGGADLLTGGTGADFFVFLSLGDAGDRILDFSLTDGDRIDVSALLDEQSYAGADPFGDGRLLRVQNGAHVQFSFDNTLIATIENTTLAQLQNSVFIV